VTIALAGWVDLSRASYRVRDAVEKAHPQQYTTEELRKANEDIKTFDRSNGETIREGKLTISVTPEVAARLKVAYSMQDQELDRLKNQSQLSTELYKQEWAFDPIHLQVGRSAIDLSVCGLGSVIMVAVVASMIRKSRNNPT
jgi:hypothetical protein